MDQRGVEAITTNEKTWVIGANYPSPSCCLTRKGLPLIVARRVVVVLLAAHRAVAIFACSNKNQVAKEGPPYKGGGRRYRAVPCTTSIIRRPRQGVLVPLDYFQCPDRVTTSCFFQSP